MLTGQLYAICCVAIQCLMRLLLLVVLTLVYSCTDRVTVVDVRKRKAKTVDYKEIERYGIERKNSPLK